MTNHLEAVIEVMISDSDIRSTFSIMKQLRPHLVEENYIQAIRRLQDNEGYTLIAVIQSNNIKALAGYRISESLAWGKFLYVDDLITDENSRSNGFAKLLFDYLEQEAHKQHCVQFHLDSGIQRHNAHRFYLNRRMDITCHHFQKSIDK